MISPRHCLELGDPRLQFNLKAAVGHQASLTLNSLGGPTQVQGRLVQVKQGRPVLSVPIGSGPWRKADLYVEIPAVNLLFESGVIDASGGNLELSHPRWAALLDRRVAPRVSVSGEVRLTREGEMDWSTGELVDMSVQGCRLRMSAKVEVEDHLLLRIPLPGIVQPVALRVRVAWWRSTGSAMEVGCEFLALSLQAETALVRCFNLPLVTSSYPGRGI